MSRRALRRHSRGAPDVAACCWPDRCASTQGIQSPNGVNSWRQRPGELKHLFSYRTVLRQNEGRHIQGSCDRESYGPDKRSFPFFFFAKFSLRNMDLKNITQIATSCRLNQRSNHICLLGNL